MKHPVLVGPPHGQMQLRFVSPMQMRFVLQWTHFIAPLHCNYRKMQCNGMYCRNGGNSMRRKADKGETLAVSM